MEKLLITEIGGVKGSGIEISFLCSFLSCFFAWLPEWKIPLKPTLSLVLHYLDYDMLLEVNYSWEN